MNRFDWAAEQKSQITIHAGRLKWTVELSGGAVDAEFSEQNGCRVFAGSIASQPEEDGAVLKAVVIEIPEAMFPSSGPTGIWAERVMHTGVRQRVGSPFISTLVAQNRSLANRYHTISPQDDRAALMEDIARAVSAKARKSGLTTDPDAHGRRLASRLLPDVLHYDPQMPSGFTFAAQNGRHPEEASQLIVDTILNGSPASRLLKAESHLRELSSVLSRRDSVA